MIRLQRTPNGGSPVALNNPHKTSNTNTWLSITMGDSESGHVATEDPSQVGPTCEALAVAA